ncbi:MAG: hypothetical protein J5I90_06790 [Caldilineales bacterium]|nr:hypothetical protein [Caldilineales bacterium]
MTKPFSITRDLFSSTEPERCAVCPPERFETGQAQKPSEREPKPGGGSNWTRYDLTPRPGLGRSQFNDTYR